MGDDDDQELIAELRDLMHFVPGSKQRAVASLNRELAAASSGKHIGRQHWPPHPVDVDVLPPEALAIGPPVEDDHEQWPCGRKLIADDMVRRDNLAGYSRVLCRDTYLLVLNEPTWFQDRERLNGLHEKMCQFLPWEFDEVNDEVGCRTMDVKIATDYKTRWPRNILQSWVDWVGRYKDFGPLLHDELVRQWFEPIFSFVYSVLIAPKRQRCAVHDAVFQALLGVKTVHRAIKQGRGPCNLSQAQVHQRILAGQKIPARYVPTSPSEPIRAAKPTPEDELHAALEGLKLVVDRDDEDADESMDNTVKVMRTSVLASLMRTALGADAVYKKQQQSTVDDSHRPDPTAPLTSSSLAALARVPPAAVGLIYKSNVGHHIPEHQLLAVSSDTFARMRFALYPDVNGNGQPCFVEAGAVTGYYTPDSSTSSAVMYRCLELRFSPRNLRAYFDLLDDYNQARVKALCAAIRSDFYTLLPVDICASPVCLSHLDEKKTDSSSASSPRPVSGLKLKACGRCKLFKYCSETCQKLHWHSFHKHDCRLLVAAQQKAAAAAAAASLPVSCRETAMKESGAHAEQEDGD